ncbi:SAM-dependent DNA methyltransferase [Candidatus Bipolaricaulota bacterium]|nr:SAM-dependent DNA methyltransferase [Candidatus Bipolaricaulota bacterium]
MSHTKTKLGSLNHSSQEDPKASPLLDYALELQMEHEQATTLAERKARGQVFTPGDVCRFMAGLFSTFPKEIRVLDPGAGVGSLAAAVCERVLRLRSPRRVELTLYENDLLLIEPLQRVMNRCRRVLGEAGHDLIVRIHEDDFVLANAYAARKLPLFDESGSQGYFDAVIMNPPYFKVGGNSEYARLLSELVHGQSNIYALFMAVASELLRPGGEMVAITPRSFCNGLYFRCFRHWFFERMGLKHAHLFESRKDTFREAGILQESLITLCVRRGTSPTYVTLSTSFGRDQLRNPPVLKLPVCKVVDNSCGDMVIRLPMSAVEAQIMDIVESWPNRFSDLGLKVSTGPVVSFRARQFLLDSHTGPHVVPLILVGNVRLFETIWPIKKKGKPVGFLACRESLPLLLPTRNYVLLRRFSAKEEQRRLTASCFLRSAYSTPHVALENHLNYVFHAERELTDDETYGIAALFNSIMLDLYFRTLSGNTQVNAREIRTMNFPDLRTIVRIGRRIKKLNDFSPMSTEPILLDALGVDGLIRQHLMEVTR